MKLSQQTKLVVVAYSLLMVSTFIPFQQMNHKPVKYNLKKRVYTVLTMLIPILASIYSINCLTVGKCEMWAWYQSIVIFAWCFSVFLMTLTFKV